jgi:7-cyano-7-deazaguanine synthase in queuosine biosynthesis
MTELLPPRQFCFDYHSSPDVIWTSEQGTFSREYSLRPESVLRSGGGNVSPLVADWVEIAFATYFSDRLARRRDHRDRGRGTQWRRRMTLRLGVRVPDFWSSQQVQTALTSCLEFLTEDTWNFEFLPRHAAPWDVEHQTVLIDPPTNPSAGVMLYSGGLDSFAGIANHLTDDHSEWMLISGAPNLRHRVQQLSQVKAIRHSTKRPICHLLIPYSLGYVGDAPVEEQSQRARSFLFLTLGAIAAARVGAATLLMCENGIGAINLPLDETQIGTSNARAAHPATLVRFNRLARLLLGADFRVRNPFWNITKGEACNTANVRELAHVIGETFSCDKFPIRVANMPQCGTCTSCLLRRASLNAANLQAFDSGSRYLRDVVSPNARLRTHSLEGLHVMEWQFQRLHEALRASDSWRALCAAFPDVRRAAVAYQELEKVSAGAVNQQLVRLYSQYVTEWEQFPARSRLRLSKAA